MTNAKLLFQIAGTSHALPIEVNDVTIGRSPEMGLIIPESVPGISRHHATICRRGQQWWLEDNNSRNGSFINQRRIRSAELQDGDLLHLGPFELRFAYAATSQSMEVSGSAANVLRREPLTLTSSKSSQPGRVTLADNAPGAVSLSINMANLEVLPGAIGSAEFTSQGIMSSQQTSLSIANQAFGPNQAWLVTLFSEIGQAIQVSTDLDEMFEVVLSQLFTNLPAERAMIGLVDSSTREVHPRVTRATSRLSDQTLEVSRTILQTAIESRSALLVTDAADDERFRQTASIQRMGIRSVLCVPLYRAGNVQGVMYLDTQDAHRQFQQRHLEIATALALFTAVAVEQFRLRSVARDEERKRQQLARYSSPAVVERILQTADDNRMLADKEDVTVLFSDLKGFTSLSEKLSPMEVVELLNGVFSRLSDIVFRHQGTLDKFIGDGMLAFFGAPLRYADHALFAVRAAWDMLSSIAELNLQRPADEQIGIRIGINSGPVVVGDIGSPTRKEYTVIGDTANIASRLESSVSRNNEITIGPTTFEAVNHEFECMALEPIRLKGKTISIQPYRVLRLRS